MFALAVRYLNGWAMAAADGARKERAEWPPHPDRVFMALAAAWFETAEPDDEGAALRWLEELPPPSIDAATATTRVAGPAGRPPVSYVPVNDGRISKKVPVSGSLDKLKDSGLDLLPEHRLRQARQFPLAIPAEPDVHLIWPDADPGAHLRALQRLVRKVTHIGHSASFVQVWIEPAPPTPRWRPASGLAALRLRVTVPGRLADLRDRCNRAAVIAYADLFTRLQNAKGKEKKMLKAQFEEQFGDRPPISRRPDSGLWQGYSDLTADPAPERPGSVFDARLLVFALGERRLPLVSTLQLTSTLRATLLKEIAALRGGQAIAAAAGERNGARPPNDGFPYPEWLSGHSPAGAPSADPHLAMFPLPFVDHEYADGRIMGLGMALPSALDPAIAQDWLGRWLYDQNGLPRPIRLFAGEWFEVEMELDQREAPPVSLIAEHWTAVRTGACQWASVTPVVLDRHFKGKGRWEQAAESIKDACSRIGLPRPLAVELHPVSKVLGAPHAAQFPHLTRKRDQGRMQHTHVWLLFPEPVCGPVLIGAGRFRGYGLCRPLERCTSARWAASQASTRPGGRGRVGQQDATGARRLGGVL